MLIGISGGSGAGKTAFIRALRAQFSEQQLGLISEDNYYKPRHLQQSDDKGVINFDIPDAIDHEAFMRDMQHLRKNEVVSRLEYTFNNDHHEAKTVTVLPAAVYLVEGLFILHHEDTRELLDLTVLIHAKDNLKIIRRITRDKTERNYPLEDVLYRYQHHVAPAYEKYIEPYLDEIDIIINNNKSFDKGVDLIAAYIHKNQG
ncbi:MAG: uridine kinase [Saprospiraceae bacterium]|nr:uridine kinase [Saprospiraceae bacterium]